MNKIFLIFVASLSLLIDRLNALVICAQDYKQTNYYLYCSNSNQVVLVDQVQVSFISASSSRFDCLTQPSLVSNVSQQIKINVCGYCYQAQTCVVTKEFIDTNMLLNGTLYQTSSSYYRNPISLTINYRCVDKAILNQVSQARVCSNASLLDGITTTTTTTSTRSTSTSSTTSTRSTTTTATFKPTTTTKPTTTPTSYCISSSHHLSFNTKAMLITFLASLFYLSWSP